MEGNYVTPIRSKLGNEHDDVIKALLCFFISLHTYNSDCPGGEDGEKVGVFIVLFVVNKTGLIHLLVIFVLT
jgi:hypothetical protein